MFRLPQFSWLHTLSNQQNIHGMNNYIEWVILTIVLALPWRRTWTYLYQSMAFLHLWCRKYLKWPPWREGKKERRELWLKIVPWNVRLFFNYQPVVRCSMGQLKIGGIPPYWHQGGSKFSPLRRENWPVRKLEAASNPFVPHSSLEAMTQRMRHWALQNTPADLFDAQAAGKM